VAALQRQQLPVQPVGPQVQRTVHLDVGRQGRERRVHQRQQQPAGQVGGPQRPVAAPAQHLGVIPVNDHRRVRQIAPAGRAAGVIGVTVRLHDGGQVLRISAVRSQRGHDAHQVPA
jgi:hypothetical protein